MKTTIISYIYVSVPVYLCTCIPGISTKKNLFKEATKVFKITCL